jgi:hypothetical protein
MDNKILTEKIKKKFNQGYLYQTRENAIKFQSWDGPPASLSLTEHLEGLRDEIVRFIEEEGKIKQLKLLGLLGVSDSALVVDEIKDKHPYEQWDNGAPMYICPNCKEVEIGHGDNNCSNCGQKLEWHYH